MQMLLLLPRRAHFLLTLTRSSIPFINQMQVLSVTCSYGAFLCLYFLPISLLIPILTCSHWLQQIGPYPACLPSHLVEGRSWSDGSTVKSTGFSWRGFRIGFQHSHDSSKPSTTPVPGQLVSTGTGHTHGGYINM